MGFMLWVAGFALVAALLVPGCLLVSALGASRLVSVLCAPVVAVGLYVALGMALAAVGAFATGPVLVGCAMAVSAALYGAARLARRRSARRSFRAVALPCEETPGQIVGRGEAGAVCRRGDWAVLALYLVLGIAVTAFMTAFCLASPESIVQEYDNVHHLGVAQAFLQSGVWSPFAANLYSTPDAAAVNPLPLGGFYPTAWSMLAALVASLTGCSVPLAANALNCTIAGVIYPISMFFLMRTLFPARLDVVAAGAVVMLASTQFPWALMIFGPLYPNMLAYALMSAVAAGFVCWLGPVRVFAKASPSDEASRPRDASGFLLGRPAACGRWFLLMLVGVIVLVFAQPNAVFSVGVYLVPFIVAKAYGHGRRRAGDRLPPSADGSRAARRCGRLWAIAACLLIAGAWVAVFSVPLIQSVASFAWPATKTLAQALREVGLLMFRFSSLNVLLVLFFWTGFVWTFRHRRWLWLACSFGLLAALYGVAQTVDGPVKALLTGFWYTDSLRLAAAAAIFAVPLAALGLAVVAKAVGRWMGQWGQVFLSRLGRDKGDKGDCPHCHAFVGAALGAIFLFASFGPSVPVSLGPLSHLGPDDEWFHPSTGAGAAIDSLSEMTDGAESPKLSDDERAFIARVQQTVPADSPIANLPFDGSAWAFGAMGLNDYYRYIGTYGVEGETSESRLIRRHLDEYAANDAVRDAVDKLGIRYVLQLDQGAPVPKTSDESFLHAVGDGFDWSGLASIDDDTPGFTPVLSEGDMRLYEIG